jgi:hypothetical protein
MLELLGAEKWLELNALLQQKKNTLRQDLKERGVLKKDKTNGFDNYNYFSEAGYKELFTELFSKHGLELKFDEIEYGMFETQSEKQPNGRLPKIEFRLFDIETGFFESTTITGEAIDKGDKAGYKAYTGALKYYLADTFMVATGDDPENESPDAKGNTKTERKTAQKGNNDGKKASPKQVELLAKNYTGENLAKLLEANGVEKLEDISMAKASELIGKIYDKRS